MGRRSEPLARRLGRWGCIGIAVAVWLPVLVFFVGLGIARAAGCRLNEAEAYSCIVGGVDIGDRLYGMAMMGWIVVFLSPLLLPSLIAMGVLLVRWGLRRRAALTFGRRDQP